MDYANEFNDILTVLRNNPNLKARVVKLMRGKPLLGKVFEGDGRSDAFREILTALAEGELTTLERAYAEVESRLSRETSMHGHDNRVFAAAWPERLVRTHLSRFYNQAVLEELSEAGAEECFVPASSSSNLSSRCAILQNQNYKVAELLRNLVNNYDLGQYDSSVKIPEHPHCSHVVKPI